jgi:hypothetical protein
MEGAKQCSKDRSPLFRESKVTTNFLTKLDLAQVVRREIRLIGRVPVEGKIT